MSGETNQLKAKAERRTRYAKHTIDHAKGEIGEFVDKAENKGAETATKVREARGMTVNQDPAKWNVADWHGKMLVDRNGEKIGKLQDVYVDVETDEPQFATVKEGFIDRHLTFVPLGGIEIGPDDLLVPVTKEQVRSAPEIDMHGEELSQADESALYHHFELNYTPITTKSGRRLARR